MSILGAFLGDKKTAGTDAGNMFVDNANQERDNNAAHTAVYNANSYTGSQDALDPLQSSRTAANEVQNGALTSGMFGKGGTMDRTNAQEQDLSGRGFSLQPEDFEAYGQGAGNIARQFGGAENSLSESLANRGMSNSGAANQAFMGAEGNKAEMLGNLQMQIAQQRMQTNMQRLGQTRNFLSSLQGQAQGAQQQQYGRQMGSEQQNYNETMGKGQAAMGYLGAVQGQNNEQMKQRAGTQTAPGWAQGLDSIGNMAEGRGASFMGISAPNSGGGAAGSGGGDTAANTQGASPWGGSGKGYTGTSIAMF